MGTVGKHRGRQVACWTTPLSLVLMALLGLEAWRQSQISSSRAELRDAVEFARNNVLNGMTPAQFTQGRVKGTNGYERLKRVAEAVESAPPIGTGTYEAAEDTEEFTPKGVSQVLAMNEWPGLKRDPPDAEKTRQFLAATEAWSAELEEISRCDVIAQVIHNGDTYGDLLGGDSLSWGGSPLPNHLGHARACQRARAAWERRFCSAAIVDYGAALFAHAPAAVRASAQRSGIGFFSGTEPGSAMDQGRADRGGAVERTHVAQHGLRVTSPGRRKRQVGVQDSDFRLGSGVAQRSLVRMGKTGH